MERVGEWEERMYRENRRERDSQPLQRSHVIEGMVQLLADGLILQLLSVQFVWRSEVGRKHQAQRSSTTAADHKQKQKSGEFGGTADGYEECGEKK